MRSLKRLAFVESCVIALMPAVFVRQAEPIVPIRPPEAVDQAGVALGEQLFSDVRLSRISQYSCATCHPLDGGGMDARQVATRAADGVPRRNTPTIFNAALNPSVQLGRRRANARGSHRDRGRDADGLRMARAGGQAARRG